eukprot:SAG22_NODE_1908_length_3330_cov_2.071804_1_plen_72_part_10
MLVHAQLVAIGPALYYLDYWAYWDAGLGQYKSTEFYWGTKATLLCTCTIQKTACSTTDNDPEHPSCTIEEPS